MTPWEDLTEVGKFRRLRPLARAALEHYPIDVTGIRSLGGFSNIIFRVDTPEGPYALRVDYQQDHTDETVEIELTWLDALARQTDLDVARPLATRSGELWSMAGADGVPGERRCVLFEWIPGKPLDEDLAPERYHQLGRLSAGLHVHGATFVPPHPPVAWDRIFYWPEAIDPVVLNEPQHAHLFTGSRRQVLDRAIAAVEPAFARLEPGGSQVTHGDLHPWNVHVARSRMIAFDFEDVCLAHRVQDVSTTLFYERERPQYPELRAAFEEGYRAVAEWPVSYDGELEHFMAARTVMFINYVLNLGTDPTEFYARAFPRLEHFLAAWG